MTHLSRRDAIALMATPAMAQSSTSEIDPKLIQRNDDYVDSLLARQITAASDRNRGAVPDRYGLPHPGSAAGLIDAATASYVTPRSRHHKSDALLQRIRLAASWLAAHQLPSGNFNLLITNFDSTPDTGFMTHSMAGAALVAQRHNANEIYSLLDPILRKAGKALSIGGVHTPNHRWVVCEALSQLYTLHKDPAYLKRIDQWLAETIDIDADGQYNERSTTVYNGVTNKALVVASHWLKRPELLEPVKRNIESMLYLLHADGEVVTEISIRQDANERGDMSRYWFPLRYLALREKDGRFAALTRRYEDTNASLTMYLQYPELRAPLPADAPLPANYEKIMPAVKIARVRRGDTSASVLFNGNPRAFTFRHGGCVVNAVRFASSFFGKGQFIPQRFERTSDGFVLTQTLEGPYYQPLDPSEKVAFDQWAASRPRRRQSEVCRMTYKAVIREQPKGFTMEIVAEGTSDVPLAVEINLRAGGKLTGCERLPDEPHASILRDGMAEYRAGNSAIRFGPGLAQHSYVRVRGALPQLPEESVYLCGFTPFRHTLKFEVV